ncbi:unnamed protein product [Cochlearia groenlandica]
MLLRTQRRFTRSQLARAATSASSQEVVDGSLKNGGSSPTTSDRSVTPHVEPYRVRRMVEEATIAAIQDTVGEVAHEAACVAAREAAREVTEEVARQMAHQAQQTHQTQDVEQTDDHTAMLEELRVYRERLRAQMVGDTNARGVRREDEEQRVNPRVGEFGGFQPREPVRGREGPTYWEVMRHMKNMGLEPFKGTEDPTVVDN